MKKTLKSAALAIVAFVTYNRYMTFRKKKVVNTSFEEHVATLPNLG